MSALRTVNDPSDEVTQGLVDVLVPAGRLADAEVVASHRRGSDAIQTRVRAARVHDTYAYCAQRDAEEAPSQRHILGLSKDLNLQAYPAA